MVEKKVYVTTHEACRLLGNVDISWVYRLIWSGKLRARRNPRDPKRWMIALEEVDRRRAFVKRMGIPRGGWRPQEVEAAEKEER